MTFCWSYHNKRSLAMSNIHRCKCLVIGDSTVGKTSIVRVLSSSSNQFSNKYLMTTDIEITLKSFKVPNSEQTFEFFLFDCSGKEFYREITQNVWSNDFPMIVAVFDVTDEKTLNSLHNWVSNALKAIDREKVIGVVLANKTDLNDRAIVTTEDGHQFAKKYKMRYFECSAKDKSGIEEAFLHLINAWLETQRNQLNINQIKDD